MELIDINMDLNYGVWAYQQIYKRPIYRYASVQKKCHLVYIHSQWIKVTTTNSTPSEVSNNQFTPEDSFEAVRNSLVENMTGQVL